MPGTMPHPCPELPHTLRSDNRLTRLDRLWLWGLAFLAAFIWVRDGSWMVTAWEVLPILVAFPLAWWCGRPWLWRAGGGGVNREWLAVAAVVWVAGITLNLTALLALAWVLALWSLLSARLEPAAIPAAARLLPLLGLGFPWLALEADRVGWYFRLSAAGVAEQLFGALGFEVARQGVLVLVQGLPISVDAECSGLTVLQAMLIAGLFVAHQKFRASHASCYWWALPALVAAAWCANTLRVLIVSAAALSFGTTFASGHFHVFGGTLILLLMFLLCLAGFSWVHRVLRAGEDLVPRMRFWAGTATLLFCAMMCGDLPRAWRSSPFDWGGQAALALWSLPVLAAVIKNLRPAGKASACVCSVFFSTAALGLLMLGTASSLNLFKHAALAVAAAAFMPRTTWTFWWLALAVSWMPVLGWAGNGAGVQAVWLLRWGLGLGAAGAGLRGLHHSPERRAVPTLPGTWWQPLALAAAVTVTLLWELAPLPDASPRLKALAREGLGFSSVEVPLSNVEAGIYHDANVIKRLYRMRSGSVVVVVIDGSKNRHAVHDPVYCFRGGGWRVIAENPLPMPGGAARRVELERGGEHAEAIYWFTDGTSRHASATRYWWQTAVRRLTFGSLGGEPVLVVIQPTSGHSDRVNWEQTLSLIPELRSL